MGNTLILTVDAKEDDDDKPDGGTGEGDSQEAKNVTVADVHTAGVAQGAEGGDHPPEDEEDDGEDEEGEEDKDDGKDKVEEDPEKKTDPDFDDMITSGHIKMKVQVSR